MIAICGAFIVFGVYVGAMAVSVADIEKSLRMSHGVFGALLALALFIGGCASAVISVRSHHRGMGATLRETFIAWAILLVVSTFAPTNWMFIVSFVATVGAAGAVDVAMNTLATEIVQGSPTGLLRVHATYNLGAAIGCAATGVAIANAFDWRWTWMVVAVCALGLSLFDWSRFDVAAKQEQESVPLYASLRSLVQENLVLVAIVFVIGAVIEGGIDAWGPLYLRVNLEVGAANGAAAASAGYVIGCASRLAMSTLSDRFGAKRCVLLGTGITCLGLTLIVSASSTLVAAIGLAFAVGGITANWPLLISYATENHRNSALITGGMSTAGYAGLVLSPAILGVVGSLVGLRSSLATLAICAVIAMVLMALLPKRRRA
jgi:MFS family permease